jgi:acyl transferase domain-containing protein/acyl-CoA synthetase (AMP-forming)/AMP-acid ligase II/NADPH:quinone reductase-like Zn-dependent oxidoreductase/NAD(P)-dependent dehydrogenase (short-subunit alcohol dehydrogenase family)/acyl carrier protein
MRPGAGAPPMKSGSRPAGNKPRAIPPRRPAATLAEVLAEHAEQRPDGPAVRFVEPGGATLAQSQVATITFGALARRAASIAGQLADHGAPGDRALLLCPPGLDYVAALFGCFYAGFVAVPAYPPFTSEIDARLRGILEGSRSQVLLTTSLLAPLCRAGDLETMGAGSSVSLIAVDELDPAATAQVVPSAPSDLALLQYTSGSTGNPRGVMLSHANILAKVSSIEARLERAGEASGAFWLPPYHDMGLVGGIFAPIALGRETTLMSPLSFISNPLLWLEAVSRYRATCSAAPNFAFELCVRKADEERVAALDLRSLDLVFNGAEPVQQITMERFVERFGPVGFRRSALMPCYGLAEATLLVTARRLSPDAGSASAGPGQENSQGPVGRQSAVSVGAADESGTMLIVDPATRTPCPEGEEGEVWFQGPSVGAGYWNNERETEAVFGGVLAEEPARGEFLCTGDLGFVRDGELYVTGRLKDLIIVGGQNYYPHDIENAATKADRRLRPGCVAAFEVSDRDGQRVVAVAEAGGELDRDETSEIWRNVRRAVAKELDLVLGELVIIERGASVKTSSGKIRRRATREAYLKGDLALIAAHNVSSAAGQSRKGRVGIGNPLRPADPAGAHRSLARALSVLPESQRDSAVLDIVRGTLAVMLDLASPEQIDPQESFKELGLDSQGSVEFSSRLAEATSLELPATFAFDYPAPAALARRLRLMAEGRSSVEASDRGNTAGGACAASYEPLAVVGMSCRFPGGVGSPQQMWDLLAREAEAISSFPADRGWDLERLYDPDPEQPGTSYVREGGFLADAANFDASFFGISPREALAMDPQQRLLLESSWEAFEDAGIDPLSLRGSQTGVFAGIIASDYLATRAPCEGIEGYRLTGATSSVASGRVAYTLGLEGPAVSVDTACSSSLVALHWACQSLRSGECSMALAGGVTVMATPEVFVEFASQRGLAPDGRCKPFADAADGTAWSEGVGMLLLERLADAQRNGHQIVAVIRGSAVNQDGASNGLTAPNGPSQQRVITQALANARLSPEDVDAVEAHGTGTTLGDPIEAQALLATYGQGRPRERPLWLGSVKSNIGHASAAAGVAGVIKMVMAMRHGALPKTLHVDRPSSHVDWSAGVVSLLTEQVVWESHGRPRRAGVSSFGISGTNAHVILEEAPPVTTRDSGADGNGTVGDFALSTDLLTAGVLPWVISAKTDRALRDQAHRLVEHLNDDAQLGLIDIAQALATRPRFDHRAVVLAGARDDFLNGLERLKRAEPGRNVEGIAPVHGNRRSAFLFTGQGSQRVGMGRELYEAFPVFEVALNGLCAQLDQHLERPLLDVLFADRPAESALDQTAYAQAGLFALEVALFRLIESWGIRADFLMGHSIGELAAAHVANVFSLEDASALVAARGRLMGSLPEGGAMVSVQASEQEVQEALESFKDRVSLAAVNAPSSVVISGDEAAVLELSGIWAERGRKTKRLRVSHAFHSHLMDGMLEEFAQAAGGVAFSPPRIPILSNLTGEPVAAELICSAEYWVRHVREPVRFCDGVRWLEAQGVTAFLELGPDGVLSAMAQECLLEEWGVDGGALGGVRPGPGTGVDGLARQVDAAGSADERAVVRPLLRRDRPEPQAVVGAVAGLWVSGMSADWASMFGGAPSRRVGLPTYPFQRERYWIPARTHGAADMDSAGQALADHPLLAATVALAGGKGRLFTGRLSLETHPWLADHAVLGIVLLPGTAFLELALYACSQIGCRAISELTVEAPLVLPERGSVQLQLTVGELDGSGRRPLTVHSRAQESSNDALVTELKWTLHARGILAEAMPCESPAGKVWPPDASEELNVESLDHEIAGLGLDCGAAFSAVRLWRRGSEVFAELALPHDQQAQSSRFSLDPVLLEPALQAIAATSMNGNARPRLPYSFTDVKLYASGAPAVRAHASRVGSDAVSVELMDNTGELVAAVGSLVLRDVSAEQLAGLDGGLRQSQFYVEWAPAKLEADESVFAGGIALLDGCEQNGRSEDGRSEKRRGSDESLRVAEALDGVLAYPDLVALGEAVDGGTPVPRLVLVDLSRRSVSESSPVPAMARVLTNRVLSLVQEWVSDERFCAARLVFVTQGAVAVRAGEQLPGLSQAPVWGLVRSAQAEHPGRFVLLDLDEHYASLRELPATLIAAAGLDESQLAVREGNALAARLTRAGSGDVLTIPDADQWRLDAGADGTLDSLSLVSSPAATGPLESGQVRVGVRAGGLNFRDVMTTLGLVPVERIAGGAAVAGEAAGIVLEVGADVERVAVGDRVMGLFPWLGPVSVTDQRLLAKVPDGWSFAQAASVTVAFLTAYYTLVDVAGIKEKERLLVHAATGGVGMAAVQLARHMGAEVFATASPPKWRTLRSMGFDEPHIASSRSLEFKERFLAATGGQGVDVVVNSIAREYVDASLGLLGDGGRFVEMGKTDIRDPGDVAERRPGVTYRAFDLIEAGPERIREMLDELSELFQSGALEPLPVRAWDIRRAPDALRFMGHARHTGKIVLTLPVVLDPQGTVLITGGTGGIGAVIARHLVEEHGVRSLVLASRRGPETQGAAELRNALESLDARVRIAACDVGDRDQLEALVASIPADHPLTAVVHAAGITDDGLVAALTPERIDSVLASKLDGAWNLHELTREHDIRAFVLFSSAAGVIGAPGQANYAAANAFVDALAAHRRAHGLPAVSMAWGLWERETGMSGRLRAVDLARMRRSGILRIPEREGLRLFDLGWVDADPLVVPIRLQGSALQALWQTGELPAILTGLIRASSWRRQERERVLLAEQLRDMPLEERGGLVLQLVRGEVAAVLGHASARAVDVQRVLKDLGFDSLLAMELRNRLIRVTGISLPVTLAFDHPTPAAVAEYLLERVRELTGEQTDGAPGADPADQELRSAIASIPIDRLRNSGLIDVLLRLARGEDGLATDSQPSDSGARLIESMEVEDLVQRAMQGSAVG